MEAFDKLLELADTLLGPKGCPWDREQTFFSLRTTVTEEVYELIEAINLKDDDKILDELGDLFFNTVFFCKLGEKEKKFTTEDVIRAIHEKLVRRHRHVFGDVKAESTADVLELWEKVKKTEKSHDDRKSAMDGIPPHLPALARAYKFLKKAEKAGFSVVNPCEVPSFADEEQLGEYLLAVVKKGKEMGLHADDALRAVLNKEEKKIRDLEASKQ